MPKFSGFPSGKSRATAIPSEFFTGLLSEIDHLGEVKVLLYCFWYFNHTEGAFQGISYGHLIQDKEFMEGMGKTLEESATMLKDALQRCLQRGTLLTPSDEPAFVNETIFFVNNSEGKAAVKAIKSGKWNPSASNFDQITLDAERPDIFSLYEKNIGPLTPLIAEDLKLAEKEYPAEWIQDAIHIAIRNNVRRWKYIETILKSWHEKGRNEEDHRNREEDRGKYIQGEYGDLVKH